MRSAAVGAPPGYPNNTVNITAPYVAEFFTSQVRDAPST
jgi:hypothetical protein